MTKTTVGGSAWLPCTDPKVKVFDCDSIRSLAMVLRVASSLEPQPDPDHSDPRNGLESKKGALRA